MDRPAVRFGVESLGSLDVGAKTDGRLVVGAGGSSRFGFPLGLGKGGRRCISGVQRSERGRGSLARGVGGGAIQLGRRKGGEESQRPCWGRRDSVAQQGQRARPNWLPQALQRLWHSAFGSA